MLVFFFFFFRGGGVVVEICVEGEKEGFGFVEARAWMDGIEVADWELRIAIGGVLSACCRFCIVSHSRQ